MTTRAPPSRPWRRLASSRPITARSPAPTTAPLTRPAFQLSSLPQPSPIRTRQPTPAERPPTAASVPPPRARVAGDVASLPTSPVIGPWSAVGSTPTSAGQRPSVSSIKFPTSRVPVASVPPANPVSSGSPSPKLASGPASVRSSPTTTAVSTASSLPNSPATKAVITPIPRVPSPALSPGSIKPAVETPAQAPKPKPTAPLPSLALPPSLVKSDAKPESKLPLVAEQETVLVQKTSFDKPKEQRDFANSTLSSTTDFKTYEKANRKKVSSDSTMRLVTITGENRGAFIKIIHSPQKYVLEGVSHLLHKKGNGEEGNAKKKDNNQKGKSIDSPPKRAFTNSNVQLVNNSIMYNSTYSYTDPAGVHLTL